MKHKEKMAIATAIYMEYNHGDDVWWASIADLKLIKDLFTYGGITYSIKQDESHVSITINIKI